MYNLTTVFCMFNEEINYNTYDISIVKHTSIIQYTGWRINTIIDYMQYVLTKLQI